MRHELDIFVGNDHYAIQSLPSLQQGCEMSCAILVWLWQGIQIHALGKLCHDSNALPDWRLLLGCSKSRRHCGLLSNETFERKTAECIYAGGLQQPKDRSRLSVNPVNCRRSCIAGVARLLDHLTANHVPAAVATSSSRKGFDLKTTKHRSLFDRFENILTGADRSGPETCHR